MLTTTLYPYDPQELIHPDCPNFRMYEVFKSDTAIRQGIDNTQGYTDLHREMDANLVLNGLQPLRDLYGSIQPSSWYRSYDLEKFINMDAFGDWWGRHPTQNFDDYFARKSHPRGGTIDFEIPSLDNDLLFGHIKDNFTYDQVIREYRTAGDPRSGWVHWSLRIDLDFANRFEAFARPLV